MRRHRDTDMTLLKGFKKILRTVNLLIPSQSLQYFSNADIDKLAKKIMDEGSTKFKEIMPLNEVRILIQIVVANKQSLSDVYSAIANLFVNVGQPELGLEYYLKSLHLKPTLANHSLYLQTLVMSQASNEKIMQECLNYVAKYYTVNKNSFSINSTFSHKKRERKLKIGYACHFLHNSVAKSIVLPFILAHDRNKVEIYCYYDWNENEERSDMKEIADHWKNTKKLSDEDFFKLVWNDDIDIFVEMNGHTAFNRYAVCMRRVAPVQISFYNWAATSGIPNIDYIIIDNKVLDKIDDKYFTEKIYRLPNAYGIANFGSMFPAVSPSPHIKNGYVTFGSFGAAHKVNEDVIKLWCEVLKRVPNSKFFMKAGALTANFYKKNFYRYFEKNGIHEDRLILEGWSNHHEMLKQYANIDIALDTFPYNGSTTTLEATWQGVPVITFCGSRLSTRTGMSILSNLSLSEHIAYTKNSFVDIAIKLANNSKRLIELRASLRNTFKNSILHDAKQFASDLENAYYFMWNAWWSTKQDDQYSAIKE